MATSGEKKWPPMGRNRWPLTSGSRLDLAGATPRVTRLAEELSEDLSNG
jgi:hypothetical protein